MNHIGKCWLCLLCHLIMTVHLLGVEEPLVWSHLKSFQENWLENLLVLELDHLQSKVLVEFPLRSRLVTSSK